jgi:hypothetical protein
MQNCWKGADEVPWGNLKWLIGVFLFKAAGSRLMGLIDDNGNPTFMGQRGKPDLVKKGR